MKSKKNYQKGFTLIEIMAVVVILGLLASLVVPRVIGQQEKAQKQKAEIDIQMLSNALTLYKLDNHNYPSTEQGLEALLIKPSGLPKAPNWTKKYVDRLPKDPWGNPYLYLRPGNQSTEYDVWSNGADGMPGGVDQAADIGNWNLDE